MNAMKAWVSGATLPRIGRDSGSVLALYTATIFLSAALLFSVQPMFAKMVLPALGGSPSVWAVSMCFFQAVLLAGYCYAHALNAFVSLRTALLVHAGVMAVAAVALPIALPSAAHEVPTGNTYLWLIGVLAAGVGLPFFAVSANAPLLQSWFSRTGHPHAADPYFLYGASNIGSLLALLAYPLMIEPGSGLASQAGAWAAGFALLAAGIMASGALSISLDAPQQIADTVESAETADAEATWRQRGTWIALSFVPSALLVGYTTVLTTDIASAPFLWVMPLALFLLTFVLVFRDEPVFSHALLIDRQPLLAALAIFGTASLSSFSWTIAFLGSLGAFLITSLVCHRELYLRRPPARRLTEFYLWMSFGGVLGGIFSALVAPQIFTSIFEFPLLVALGLLARPVVREIGADVAGLRRALMIFAAGSAALAVIGFLISNGLVPGHPKLRLVFIGACTALMIVERRRVATELAAVVLMLSTIAFIPEGASASHAVRSFFGVHRVVSSANGDMRLLMHGTTVHGAERRLDAEGRPLSRPVPATYYHPQGPMARTLDLVRNRVAETPRVGVVGLGAGSMACHAKAEETWRFFEIDKAVLDLAKDASQFSFLSKCRPDAEVVIGDARLTLAREPDQAFDYLIIDAFSSDSIPTHLLTIEALNLYFGKLKPDGVLLIHVSNRHLDLKPVVAADAARIEGLTTILVDDIPEKPGFDAAPSEVVIMSRNAEAVADVRGWRGARSPAPATVEAWTDDYSDVMSALVRGWMR